jgi:hypothetical protein
MNTDRYHGADLRVEFRNGFHRLAPLACGLLLLLGCGGGGGSGPSIPPVSGNPSASVSAKDLLVTDINGVPIAGAVVTVTIDGATYEETTGADGVAHFTGLRPGEWSVDVSAGGFESMAWGSDLDTSSARRATVVLHAAGAWAVGRAIVLGTDMVDRASDGSAMTFSVDVAVIDANSEPIETLTSADFSLDYIDCGWGGPRDCASDADGNATPNWSPPGDALAFALHPAQARHPYVLAVLAERSTEVTDWSERAPALRSFFAEIGGNDVASLSSVETLSGRAKLTTLGPFTSDGSSYFAAIDELARPAGDPPELLESIETSIGRVADAEGFGLPDAERTLLVLSSQWTTVAHVDAVTAAAREAGVRVSTATGGSYGLPEMAARTGGFAVEIGDSRALGMIFRALDRVLGGSMPHYRMQFRLEGVAGTFVAGGNARLWLRIGVPAVTPNRGVVAQVNVAVE